MRPGADNLWQSFQTLSKVIRRVSQLEKILFSNCILSHYLTQSKSKNMEKYLRLSPIFLLTILLSSCGPSPESAAQEVCDCMDKFKKSGNLSEMTGNMAECGQIQQKYAQKFEGEDLNTFVKKTTECTMAGLFK